MNLGNIGEVKAKKNDGFYENAFISISFRLFTGSYIVFIKTLLQKQIEPEMAILYMAGCDCSFIVSIHCRF